MIPLEQGSVFRLNFGTMDKPCLVSIPLEQGSVFRQNMFISFGYNERRLNPFGTGQCLSTENKMENQQPSTMSQSLWNRAVSFDSNFTTQ